jgi:hypothetical protein
MNKTYKVELTLEELRSLKYGERQRKISPEIQAVLDLAEQEASYGFDFPYTNEVIAKAVRDGRLEVRSIRMSFCTHCKKSGGYLKYKSGRNKGRSNYKKPTYLYGYKINPGFVTVQFSGDICSECEQQNNVFGNARKYILDYELPVELVGSDWESKTKFKRDPIEICFSCKKEMQESKMGSMPALISGYFKAICPHCGATAAFLGASHKRTDKFVMIKF